MKKKALASVITVLVLVVSLTSLQACGKTNNQDATPSASSEQASNSDDSSPEEAYSDDELNTFFTDLESMAAMMEQSAKMASSGMASQGLPTSSYEILGIFDNFLFYGGTFDGMSFDKMEADDQARALELIKRYETAFAQCDPEYASKMDQYTEGGFQSPLSMNV